MPENKSDLQTPGNELLIQILDDLLQHDENITARAVARLHPHISHASTITRSQDRSDLLKQYQAKQRDIRRHVGRLAKNSKERVAVELASKDQRIAELERQIDILRASHLAMIRAVGELGGMSQWAKFFVGYKEARNELIKLNTVPNIPNFSIDTE